MHKQLIGSIFFLISGILYSTKYISAAITGASSTVWNEEEYIFYLSLIPNEITIVLYFSLFIGVVYFVWGFLELRKKE